MRPIDADTLPVHKAYCVDEAGFGATFYVVDKSDIDNAPTIDAVPVVRWIPVTERLPSETRVIDGEEYTKHVAVSVRGVPFEVIAFYDEEYDCWFDDDFLPVAGEVTHWMPLPEPPKEGE